MYRFIGLFFICTLIFSCRSQRELVGIGKKDFIEEFKTLSFCRCIENGSNRKFNLAAEDVSCRLPDFMYSHYAVIDSLGKIEAIKIKQDSVSRIGRVAEGMDGKVILFHCIRSMNSKALRKIAKARYLWDVKILKQDFR